MGIFRGERERAERESVRRQRRGGRISSLGSIVAPRRYYLLYTRCLCRRADSVDSRLKSRILVCALLFLSFSRGARSPVIAANDVRTYRRGGAVPAIAADRSLHLSELRGAPSSGTDELIVYHNS